jgi:FAD/FMN-containing dehydrogenase
VLPRLSEMPITSPLFADLFAELRTRGFEGDLSATYAERVVQAIAFPRSTEDLVRIARLTCDPRFADMTLAARGGGTGTNGQSLTDGLVVDVSRHMNRILEINAEERWVRVQAGVVKDQLSAAIAPLGLFFPPELSTSNRATIGGMVSTDACGQGSCLYGKTRDHVLELTTVLLDGTIWHSGPLTDEQLGDVQCRPDRVGAIHRRVDTIHREQADLIAASFPKLNRCLTGYDLAHIRDARGRFDRNAILHGSEGTLGLLAEAKLNLVPIPRCRALAIVRYGSFDAALRDARALIEFGASSIETVDSTVLSLARGDAIWQDVRPFIPDDDGAPALGVNIVEFVGSTEELVEAPLRGITGALTDGGRSLERRGFTVARGVRLLHPIQALLGLLRERAGEPSSSVAQGTQVGGFPPSDVETIG